MVVLTFEHSRVRYPHKTDQTEVRGARFEHVKNQISLGQQCSSLSSFVTSMDAACLFVIPREIKDKISCTQTCKSSRWQQIDLISSTDSLSLVPQKDSSGHDRAVLSGT